FRSPLTYRNMHGFGSHTFSFINTENERVWIKFHFKTKQGIKNFNSTDANEMRAHDPDHAQRDLVEAIAGSDFPKWDMKIQVMTNNMAAKFKWNPFDLTK